VVGTLAGTLIVDLWALYVTLAGAMIPAIVVVTGYGDMPLRTSWRLFHRNLGAASGRLLRRGLGVLPSGLTLVFAKLIPASADAGLSLDSLRAIGDALTITGVVLAVPAAMIMIVGSLLTYAEMRARIGPLRVNDLASSMNRFPVSRAPELRDLSTWKPRI
jgi:hypothetical protein